LVWLEHCSQPVQEPALGIWQPQINLYLLRTSHSVN
jgi:hypothetical protein